MQGIAFAKVSKRCRRDVTIHRLLLPGGREARVVDGARDRDFLLRAVRRLDVERFADLRVDHRQDFPFHQDGLLWRRPRARFGRERANPHRIEIFDDKQQKRHPLVGLDFDTRHDPGGGFGFRDVWLLADGFDQRGIHRVQFQIGRGGIRAEIVSADLTRQDGVRAQDRPDPENAHGNRGDHHRHASARGLQVAQ